MIKSSTMKLTVIASLGLALSACGQSLQTRGYLFDKELADAIQPGIDNRKSVEATMGTPTLQATFDDKVWYYVSTTVKVRPLFYPEPKTRLVMAVSFNDKDVVSDVTKYDMSSARNIAMVQEKTATRGKELSFFQQLFMNVGRFSGQQQQMGDQGPGPNGS